MNCLFLVSDEGYGHTVRQSRIANELAGRGVNITFQCRDPLPLAIKILDRRVRIHEYFNLIRLIKQRGSVDIELTYKFLQDYIARSKKWIDYMIRSSHVLNADLIITDIVEEAGLLSEKLGKPAVAISHFTWHWLLHELDSRFEDISQYLETCLQGVSEFIYPPFSKYPEQFPNPMSINLIAREPKKREEVREEFGVREEDIVIILAGGGTTTWKDLFSSLSISGRNNYILLTDQPITGSNIKQIPNPYRLHDYVNASNLVISRGGYGTISEVLAYGIRHLILLEKNHPEAIENAKMLERTNKAIVRNLTDFLNDPFTLIDEALSAKIDLSKMKSDGHIQAVDRLLTFK